MLPVTRHKLVHVPHSLATIAAVVGLVTAIALETPGDDPVSASVSSTPRSGIDSARAQAEPDNAERSVRTSASECKSACERDSLAELLPLVLPRLSRP